MDMKALLIKTRWLDLILDGHKTWELRGTSTKTRGTIALVESGTGEVRGVCELADVIGPLTSPAGGVSALPSPSTTMPDAVAFLLVVFQWKTGTTSPLAGETPASLRREELVNVGFSSKGLQMFTDLVYNLDERALHGHLLQQQDRGAAMLR